MKTNRRKYRTFSRHGDFLFTKREANKRNRKDAKKMLTNIAQCVIMIIVNEREVIKMFLLGWMIDGVLTVIGCILLACAFGNSPITFLFFFVFPIAFILIWCKIFEKNC